MKISRGKTKDTVSFTGRGPISNAAIWTSTTGTSLILIDTNDDRAVRVRAVRVLRRRQAPGRARESRTRTTSWTARSRRRERGPRGFRQVIQRAKIHSPGTYRFIAGSYYQGVPMLGSSCVHRHDPQPIPSVDPARSPSAVVRLGQLGDLLGRCLGRSDLPDRVPCRRRPVRHGRQGVDRPDEGIGWRTQLDDGGGRQGPQPDCVRAGGRGRHLRRSDDRGGPTEEPEDLDHQAHHVPVRRRCRRLRPTRHAGRGRHRLVPRHHGAGSRTRWRRAPRHSRSPGEPARRSASWVDRWIRAPRRPTCPSTVRRSCR